MLQYTSPNGYHYKQKKSGCVVRVSADINGGDPERRVDYIGGPPKKGDFVKIIVKPYCARKYVFGVVAVVLTKSRYHTRGHKVKLACGKVGRMIAFVKKDQLKRR